MHATSLIQQLTPQDKDFPPQFLTLSDPPETIYVLGDLQPLKNQPRLSIVGTRTVSPYGKDVTTRLARQATEHGLSIISGLALGVDALSHRAALAADGYTVAVLAGGLHEISPRNHTTLAHQILQQGGALISEYPPGEPAQKHQFVERNRLVAALGDALLITEAAAKSGTMHTAEFALDLGRTVLAVPGNITSRTSEGTNNLLKQGAEPATDIKDILHVLGIKTTAQQRLPIGSNQAETAVLYLLARGLSDINELQVKSQLTAGDFNQTLTMLELTGKIRSLGGGHWALL